MFNTQNPFKSLSLGAKFALSFSAIVLCMQIIMLAIVIPTWQNERLSGETTTMNRLLTNMENQVLLTIHVNSLYNASYWEKMNLQMQNRLHLLINAWKESPKKEQATLISLLNEHFMDFTCNALLLHNNQALYGTQGTLEEPSPFFTTLFPTYEAWSIYDKTKRLNICPTANKEYMYLKKIPQSPYDVALFCKTKEFLKHRSEFEISIGSMLKQSFQSIKNQSTGFAYMMWVDGRSDRVCDHNATFRKSHDENAKHFNTACCVSESSPTDQPLTGDLTTAAFLKAAKEGKPIKHLLPKPDNPEGKRYPALTWVRYFEGSREYPLLLVATLYEEEIYSELDPIILKFFPAIILALGVAFALGWFLFRGVTCKIDRLLCVAKTIKSGHLKERSHLKGDDDISLLAQTFDTMLDGLEKNIQTLDENVAKRTHELEEILVEKEVLLKEIHHRVKNNLSIIIALMQLKENEAKHDESKQLLVELQERIYAIELLHRQLYQSSSLTHIAFETYVQGLIENMRQTYALDEKNIVLHVKVQNAFLSIEQTLACGLLINECVTNSIKHAFDTKGGEIFIEMRQKGKICRLSISDTGRGFSLLNSPNRQGLGMQLIEGIVRQQLRGKVNIKTEQGTQIHIRFLCET